MLQGLVVPSYYDFIRMFRSAAVEKALSSYAPMLLKGIRVGLAIQYTCVYPYFWH